MKRTTMNSAMLAAVMAAAAGMPGVQVLAGDAQPTARVAINDQQPVKKAADQRVTDRRTNPYRGTLSGAYTGGDFRRAGPGWSNRHVQRMAVKKRNQARHRKACR